MGRVPHTSRSRPMPARRRCARARSASRRSWTATSPCTPSRAATYTGLHFQATGVFDNSTALGARADAAATGCAPRAPHGVLRQVPPRRGALLQGRARRGRERPAPAARRRVAPARAARGGRVPPRARPHPWLSKAFDAGLGRWHRRGARRRRHRARRAATAAGRGGDASFAFSSVARLPGRALEGHVEDAVTADAPVAFIGARARDDARARAALRARARARSPPTPPAPSADGGGGGGSAARARAPIRRARRRRRRAPRCAAAVVPRGQLHQPARHHVPRGAAGAGATRRAAALPRHDAFSRGEHARRGPGGGARARGRLGSTSRRRRAASPPPPPPPPLDDDAEHAEPKRGALERFGPPRNAWGGSAAAAAAGIVVAP